jgi:excisionase family DNA binding protein
LQRAEPRCRRSAPVGNGRQLGVTARTVTEYLTIADVCDLLKLSERTVYDLCRRGQLAGAAKIGNQWRVEKSKLVAWLESGGVGFQRKGRGDK